VRIPVRRLWLDSHEAETRDC